MKKHFWIFLAVSLFTVACQKDTEFYDDFNDDDTEIIDGSGENNNDPNNPNTDDDNGEERSLTLYQVTGDNIDKIKDFDVSQNLLPFQQDYAKHLKMWEFTTRLIPIQYRDKIAQFEVFHGNDDLLGYVVQVEEDLSSWKFALAIDAVEQLETIDFQDLFTMVTLHEYGHVLTLNDDQVNANTDEQDCNSYHTGEGCSSSNSYINRLYDLAWSDITENDPFEVYEKYTDRFLTEYSANNPGEDIAEVFTYFIITPEKPNASTIANQKIRLLYEYPELVKLREDIRQNEAVRSLKLSNWKTNPLRKKFKIGTSCTCKKHKAPWQIM